MSSTGIPVGLLQISSDRDDRRFLGVWNFKFRDFFVLENFDKYFWEAWFK